MSARCGLRVTPPCPPAGSTRADRTHARSHRPSSRGFQRRTGGRPSPSDTDASGIRRADRRRARIPAATCVHAPGVSIRLRRQLRMPGMNAGICSSSRSSAAIPRCAGLRPQHQRAPDAVAQHRFAQAAADRAALSAIDALDTRQLSQHRKIRRAVGRRIVAQHVERVVARAPAAVRLRANATRFVPGRACASCNACSIAPASQSADTNTCAVSCRMIDLRQRRQRRIGVRHHMAAAQVARASTAIQNPTTPASVNARIR